jgi:hypothetical protein
MKNKKISMNPYTAKEVKEYLPETGEQECD